jgi:hypothetical protein
MMTPINSGMSEADPTSPYLRHKPRTLEQAQTDYDRKLVAQTIAEHYARSVTASRRGDDETAETLHKRALALGRVLAKAEGRGRITEQEREARDGR